MNKLCCEDIGVELYIDLLKKSLLNTIHIEAGMRVSYLLKCLDTGTPYVLENLKNIIQFESEIYENLLNDPNGKDNYRERIFGFPATMIGQARLENIQDCVTKIVEDRVAGDLMEAGVWRGGGTIFMRGLLKAFNVRNKIVWVADSFKGVPPPTVKEDEGMNLNLDPMLAVNIETVKENFARYGLLDQKVRFIEGLFEDTMPSAPVENLSILRIDADLYKSTMDVLLHMYDKVEPGGFIIIDDYGAFEACRKAVEDFRSSKKIREPIEKIDWTGIFWRKNTEVS